MIEHFSRLFVDLILCVSSAVPSPDLHYGSWTWLNDAHLLVFAAGGQQAAVGVEGHAEDDVGVAVNHFHRLPDLQVPDQDLLQLEKQRAENCGVWINIGIMFRSLLISVMRWRSLCTRWPNSNLWLEAFELKLINRIVTKMFCKY